ncbi:MAG: ABC transporter substrate-binding protein [Chloroflexi bacterium]|nr:MAG: ABC transporter substrate-binding protein [Chloroflexota bacterium]
MTGSGRPSAPFARWSGLLVVVIILAAACGGTTRGPAKPSARANDQMSALIAAARAEVELDLSWAPGFLDSPDELRRETEGFNRIYGLNLKVPFKAGASMREGTARTIQDFQSGAKASTDIVLGTEADINDLAKSGVLISEPWSAWSPNITSPRMVAVGGVAVQVQTRMPGITYNSAKLSGAAAPRTLADLLRPEYKGRVATTLSTALFERLAGSEVWGPERTLAYVRKLAGQVTGFVECGDEDRIANGEFDAFVYDCGGARVQQMKAKGTLIGWSVPSDGALLGYLYMGVPKNATHPNAAKLWISYMLGREAQDLMYEYGYADHHLVPGSKTFLEVDRATKSGAKFYELTVEAIQVDAAKGAKAIGAQLQAILRDAVAQRK